jgi:hypothetical protein
MVLQTPATMAKPGGSIASSAAGSATVTLDVAGARQTFRLLHPTRIGRSPHCHIRLGGSAVLPEHVTLLQRGTSWMVEVAPMAPPVEINDVAVRSALLRAGDVISVGGVQIEFQSARGDRENPSTQPVPAQAPKDPHDIKRAWVVELSKRQSSVDLARAELEAERDQWLIRLAAEKKQVDEQSRAAQKRIEAAEEKLRLARNSSLTEQRQARLEIDRQREEITRVREALAEERVRLAKDQAEQARVWHEMKVEHDRQLNEARGTRSASVRMLQQLERDRLEVDRRLRQVEAAESRLAQAQSRIERQVEIGSHELAGLQRRIDNERILLADLQRRRLLAERGPKITDALADATASPADVASLEELAAQLQGAIGHVERGAQEVAVADRRLREQEIRLQHLARHLALEEQRLSQTKANAAETKNTELDKKGRLLDVREAELARRHDQLLAAQARWELQRSASEETQASERTNLDRMRDRLRSQRWRLAIAHRQRLHRIRQSRQQLRKDQERVLVRIAQLARQEARLEILKQEIGHLRLAQIEQAADQVRSSDPLGSASFEAQDRALKQRQFCEQEWARYEARLQRTIEWIENELASGKSQRRRPERTFDAADRLRVENASLSATQLEREKAWEVERRTLQLELTRLRGELESMAAHLITPGAADAA